MTATMTIRNGINVDQLMATVGAITDDAHLGTFTFRASSTWQEGTHSTGQIGPFTHAGQTDTSRPRPFQLEGDEPPVLLGTNHGANAVELVLQALAFCYAVGYVANAAAQGLDITRADFEVEGDLDVGPFLGLKGPRPGFSAIRATARVSSTNATAEQLEDLFRYVQDTSPVRDCLTNPIPIQSVLEVM